MMYGPFSLTTHLVWLAAVILAGVAVSTSLLGAGVVRVPLEELP